MTLASGARLGPYEILSPLGAGGMGEVYRARDARLDRTVAIKVLPADAASDPDRRARFEREARAISQLNHTHICTLHDMGHQDGTDYLVMELVEGETLAERLKKGPLPASEVLRYGEQIAEADGKRIAFFASHGGETNKVYWQPADGSGPAERLTTGEHLHWPNAFSPDGRLLLWAEYHPETGPDLWVLPLDGERRPRPLLRTPFAEGRAVFSPDGRYTAYVSDQTGREEVYVQGFDGPGARWQVSTDGGREPRWVGGEILYRSGDRVMSVAVRTRPAFSAEKPRVRFEGWFETCPLPACRSFDVGADGRDLVVLDGDQGPPTEIRVVLGWFRELEAAFSGESSGFRR